MKMFFKFYYFRKLQNEILMKDNNIDDLQNNLGEQQTELDNRAMKVSRNIFANKSFIVIIINFDLYFLSSFYF